MASKTEPVKSVPVADDDTAYYFGGIAVWFDPRGGINVQGHGESLIIHPRTGRSLRVVHGEEDAGE